MNNSNIMIKTIILKKYSKEIKTFTLKYNKERRKEYNFHAINMVINFVYATKEIKGILEIVKVTL